MRHLHDREFEVIILKNHYCHLVEHSRKFMETYFVLLTTVTDRTYEGTSRSATLRFVSFINHLIENIELIKSLNRFVRRAFSLGVMAVLLNFGPVTRDFRKNQIQGFRPEILSIDSSIGH
jgi:hypothetical protein